MKFKEAIRRLEQAIMPDPHDEMEISGPWLVRQVNQLLPFLRKPETLPGRYREVLMELTDLPHMSTDEYRERIQNRSCHVNIGNPDACPRCRHHIQAHLLLEEMNQ